MQAKLSISVMPPVGFNDMVHDRFAPKGEVRRLPIRPQEFEISGNHKQLETFGFKLTEGGAHTSRTIMLKEISRLLAVADREASSDDFRRLIVTENILGKRTEATRLESMRRLRELYALSPKVPIFSVYRELMSFDPQSASLLSLLVGWAREEKLCTLRKSAPRKP